MRINRAPYNLGSGKPSEPPEYYAATDDDECTHFHRDGRSAYVEVMHGTAQRCAICDHVVGNWET